MAEDFRHGIDWREALEGVPVGEPLDERKDIFDNIDLSDVVQLFIDEVEAGTFLTWEAVIRQEQDLPLSEAHEERLDKLISFDERVEDVLYIDECARPPEPWYETLRRIAPHLLVETFDTAEPPDAIIGEGWDLLVEALDEHGQHLSLPEGVTDSVDVVPEELRHRLWVQTSFDELAGIGQEGYDDEVITLENEEGRERFESFVDFLRECKEDVAALGLTLEKLLEILIMPPKERELFVEMFSKKLDLESATAPIADYL